MASIRETFRDLIPRRQAPELAPGATPDELAAFAAQMGYGIAKGPGGKMVPVPLNGGREDGNLTDFAGDWKKIYDSSLGRYDDRSGRLKTYDMMDGSGAEGAVVLDTYADEVVNITDNSDKAIRIEISDKDIQKSVMQVLQNNQIIENLRQDIRSICKYGDGAYVLEARRGKELTKIVEGTLDGAAKIAQPFKPDDLTLRWVSSPAYELAGYKGKTYRLKVVQEETGGYKYEYDEYSPWEFATFNIRDRDTFPYGQSVLEKMRVPWQQLTVLEKLLAAARANSIDRIAVSVPGLGTDVSSAMAKLSTLKNSVKTILQIGQNGRMTRNQDIGITEWLWLPESFKVQKLATSVKIGEPNDVIYYRDKLYNASRLPKGFFVIGEATGAQRPMSLRQQDLKFARSLIPIAEGYANGLKHLITLLCFYLGADVSKIKIKVSFAKAPYVSAELLAMYKDIMGLIETQNQVKKVVSPDYKATDKDVRRLLELVGAPTALFFEEEGNGFDGNTSSPGSLMEAVAQFWGDRESIAVEALDDPATSGTTRRAALNG
jgi:hypothetical protein